MTNHLYISKKMNSWIFPGYQRGSLMHSIAGKAVAFKEALEPKFKEYIQNVISNTNVFTNELISNGVSIISNGTDNHLFTFDVKISFGTTGKEVSILLQKNHITVNKNTIPNDTELPFVTW